MWDTGRVQWLLFWCHWGFSVGSAGLDALPEGQRKAVTMDTCWDVLLHLQWLQVPAEHNTALLTLEACAETATFYQLNTPLGSTEVFTRCTLTLTSRISRSHPYSEQLLDFSIRNPIFPCAPWHLSPWHWINEIDIFPATATHSMSKNKVYYFLWGVYFFGMQCREAWGHVCLLAWPQQSSGVCRVRCHISHHK